MVPTADEGRDLPPYASIDLDEDADRSSGLVLAEGEGVVRRDGDVTAVYDRRPDVGILVALVVRRDPRTKGDLLVPVDGVDVEAVVVDAEVFVGVVCSDSDLEVGGEEVRDGGVEVVDGDVLKDELRLLRAENCPHEEDGDKEDEVEDEEAGA